MVSLPSRRNARTCWDGDSELRRNGRQREDGVGQHQLRRGLTGARHSLKPRQEPFKSVHQVIAFYGLRLVGVSGAVPPTSHLLSPVCFQHFFFAVWRCCMLLLFCPSYSELRVMLRFSFRAVASTDLRVACLLELIASFCGFQDCLSKGSLCFDIFFTQDPPGVCFYIL